MNVNMPLTVQGISNAIQQADAFKGNLLLKAQRLVDLMGQEGMNVASVRFGRALYSGDNDVTVSVDKQGDLLVAVVATGNATLFIEFGTGVVWTANPHPEADKLGMVRGEYGQGRGKSPKGWFYRGSAGTNGEPAFKESPKSRGLMHTYGDPASKPMYYSVEDLKQRVHQLVRQVFR